MVSFCGVYEVCVFVVGVCFHFETEWGEFDHNTGASGVRWVARQLGYSLRCNNRTVYP